MTFRKAIRLKAKQSSIFEESGIIHKDGIAYKVFVTPENNDDFMRYLRDIRGFYSQLTDSVAKKYSKMENLQCTGYAIIVQIFYIQDYDN